jgi:transposase
MRNVALDLAVRKISFCEVKDEQVVQRRTVSRLDALEDLLGQETPAARVAIEACREAWHVHDRLTGWGHEVLIVDTTRVRQLGIGHHRRKNDRIDAEVLARAVERGQIPLAHLLSPHRRQMRYQLSVRRALVETRAQYVTTVRGILRGEGKRLPGGEVEQFTDKLRRAKLQDPLRQLVAPLANSLDMLNEQIAELELRLAELCQTEPVIEQLATAPGVGLIVAACFVSVIDEANRFGRAHQVQAYLGLVPSENTSVKRKLGAITKQGNSYVRAMLVQASWQILRLRAEDPLKTWAMAIAKRRGKRIAVVALARRLAGVLWAMWRDGTVYDPALVGDTSARGLKRQAQDIQLVAAAQKRAAVKKRRHLRHANKISLQEANS